MLQFNLFEAYTVLIIGMGFLVVVGSLDDALDLNATTKLIAQLIAAALLVLASGLPPFSLGHIAASNELTMLASAGTTLFLILWIVNSVNMVDGVDGLVGGLALVSLAWLGIGAALVGSTDMPTIVVRLIVPTIAFLAFNHRGPWRKRASVFMGDAGTMMLGYGIAWFCLELRSQGVPMLACTLVIAIPLIDTASLFFRRLYAGKNPFRGDRYHLHHLMEAARVPTAVVPLLMNGAATVVGGLGILGACSGLPPVVFAAVWLFLVVAHTILVGFLLHRTASAANATAVPEATR